MHNQEYKDKMFTIWSNKPFYYRNSFAYIDDEKLIIDNTKLPWERVLYGIFALGFIIFFVWTFTLAWALPNRWSLGNIFGGFFGLLTILICLIILVNVILNTERKFVFNRLEGTLTMRSSVLNWKPGTITIPFDEAFFSVTGPPVAQSFNVSLPQYNSRFIYLKMEGVVGSDDATNCTSFFVWYMDRNRPLPPGKDLDPYRMKDYERRKAEGFPPLYINLVEECQCRLLKRNQRSRKDYYYICFS